MQQRDGSTGAALEEDSGLHDIRNLASSQRMRLSALRISQPNLGDEDVLASSSGAWKAVALPEPAKMVALPSLAEASEASEASESNASMAAATGAPSVTVTPIAAARKPAAAPARSGKGIYAIAGGVVAIAAGVAIFMTVQKRGDDVDASRGSVPASSGSAALEGVAPAGTGSTRPAVITKPIEVDASVPVIAPTPDKSIDVKSETPTTTPPPDKSIETPPTKPPPVKIKGTKSPLDEGTKKRPSKTKVIEDAKPEPPVISKPVKSAKTEDSLDELLKEAGATEPKQDTKPKLDRDQLSGDDFKKGMAVVAKRAQACYLGTQGTASLKIMISPSGKVQKVTVSGPFAGQKEGACVEAAVRGASFPPWDGAPQSFGFSYLLSE